jgi:hypothetical protein
MSGRRESQTQSAKFNIERENSDQFSMLAATEYEFLLAPFTAARGVTIPVGGYTFSNATAQYSFGQQRRMSGMVALQAGEFYDGTLTALDISSARIAVITRWSVEPSVSINQGRLPAGDFTTTVLRTRSDFGFTPRMFASALLQYSSNDQVFSSNLRFRWEYLPGSELFVVYTDERDTTVPGYPGLRNRAFVVKIDRLLRF